MWQMESFESVETLCSGFSCLLSLVGYLLNINAIKLFLVCSSFSMTPYT